jgi:PAS domain S-box-containing protein
LRGFILQDIIPIFIYPILHAMITGQQPAQSSSGSSSITKGELFYRSLFAHSLDGILVTNEQGLINFASPSVTSILEYDPESLVNTMAFGHVHPDDCEEAVRAFSNEVSKSPEVKFISIRLKKKSGDYVWCIVRGHNLLAVEHIKGMVIYFYDDTLRKKAKDELVESEKRFREQTEKLKQREEEFKMLVQNLRQGVVVQNAEGKVILTNYAAQQILALPEEKLLGAHSYEKRWDVIHEDGSSVPPEEHPAVRVFKSKQPVRDEVLGILKHETGERVWVMVNADPSFDAHGNISNVLITFTDITEQKKLSRQLIEQEIHKQKLLTQATIDGQEKERLEMGKELHDNINQHLNTTRLYLEVARDKATGEIREMINFSHKALAGIIDKIRFLSQSLVPPTLGDIGLVESIQDVCDSLRRTHKFRVEFFHRHFEEQILPENMRLMIFRITQEQVNNIIRHAEAHTIYIKLESDAEYVVLTISDDGIGFDPVSYKKGLGITNITNRASLFNGIVEIDAAKGKGCKLSVIIPLQQSNNL